MFDLPFRLSASLRHDDPVLRGFPEAVRQLAAIHRTGYRSTDNLVNESWIGMPAREVIDAVDAAGLGFDHRTGTGVVVHMLSGLGIDGSLGLTAFDTTRWPPRRCTTPTPHAPSSPVQRNRPHARRLPWPVHVDESRSMLSSSPDEQKHHRTTGRVRMRGLTSAPCRSTAAADPAGSRRHRLRNRPTCRPLERRSSRSRSMGCSRRRSPVPFSCSAASPAGWPARWSSEHSHWWPYSCSPRRGRHGNPGRPQQVAAAGAGGAEAP